MAKQTRNDTAFVRRLLVAAEKQGHKAEDMVSAIGLDYQAYAENRLVISPAQVGPLLRELAIYLDDDMLGFLSRGMTTEAVNMGFHATISSTTLGEAFEGMATFYRVITDDLHLEFNEQGDNCHLLFNYSNPHQVNASVFILLSMLTIQRWASWLIGKTLLLERVHIADSVESHSDVQEYLFSCRLYSESPENVMVFDRRYLEMPVIKTAKQLAHIVTMLVDNLAYKVDIDETYTSSVQRLLQQGTGQFPTLKSVAEQLKTTSHTLSRRLREEGNTFATIKESVRRDMAIYQLIYTDQSIQTIAFSMGFSEQSAFSRAFKKWTGQAPGQYRENFAEKASEEIST